MSETREYLVNSIGEFIVFVVFITLLVVAGGVGQYLALGLWSGVTPHERYVFSLALPAFLWLMMLTLAICQRNEKILFAAFLSGVIGGTSVLAYAFGVSHFHHVNVVLVLSVLGFSSGVIAASLVVRPLLRMLKGFLKKRSGQ